MLRGTAVARREAVGLLGPSVRRSALARATLALWLCACSAPAGEERAAPSGPPATGPNVLLISIDDLSPWALEHAHTPNLDRLAARGVRFDHAYAPAPLCNPSRAAVLSGLHPTRSGVYGNRHDARELLGPERTLLPEKFAANGYRVIGCGKVYHYGRDDPRGWHTYCRIPGQDPAPDPRDPESSRTALGFGPLDVDEESLRDVRAAEWAAEQLGREYDRPFLLAVGFERPHLSWYVPRRYFELHPLNAVAPPEVDDRDLEDVPPIGRILALVGAGFEAPSEGDDAVLRRLHLRRRAVRAYLAATSFADAAVGRVLAALERSPHRDDTMVAVWSDHGFHLGEKLHWRKAALWEEATAAVLLLAGPGVERPGARVDEPVGLIDLYPTLVELAGLAPEPDLDGASLAGALRSGQADAGRAIVTSLGPANHALRTQRWRYIRYADGSEELYDHEADPHEWTNRADDPAFAEAKRELASRLPARPVPDPLRDSEFRDLESLRDRLR